MPKTNIKSKQGFTIIEVTLVLAIAGLIFMMVFLALPALQRAQRDTQRQNDVARLSTQLNNFQASNKGAIPGAATAGDTEVSYVNGQEDKSQIRNKNESSDPKRGTWGYFYKEYLLAGSDTFADPDGDPYGLLITKCANTTSGKPTTGNECDNTAAKVYSLTYEQQSEGQGRGSNVPGHAITIVLHATCNGETAEYSTGKRKVAILYKKEGGGVICVNN